VIQSRIQSARRPLKGGRSSRHLELPFAPETLRRPLIAWYHRNDRQLPWRNLWAKKRDPYHIWVSEIMLQQTVIKAVIPVYHRFLEQFPSVQHLASASEDDVRKAVRGLGYYRRFRFLHEAAKKLSLGDWKWPKTFVGWKALPGVGEYTAAAVSSIAFDEPVAVVDGNVERVLCRLLDLQVSPAEPGLKPQFKKLAQSFLDPSRPGDFNQALMELGQLCCTVSSPSCDQCPLASGCLAKARKTQSLAPRPKERPTATRVTLRLGIIYDKGRVALVERPSGAKFLRQSWGFLTGILGEQNKYRWDGGDLSPIVRDLNEGEPLQKRVKHTITHHKIEVEVIPLYRSVVEKGLRVRWIAETELEEALVSNLDRKAWKLFLRETHGSL
jgi:A/G-specific adenine glycosylase